MYRLHLPSTVLDPLQVDVAEAGTRHPLQAVHIVFIDLHTKDLRVTLNVVPLGIGLQCILDGCILEPGGQFGRVDQVVDNTLKAEGEEDGREEGGVVGRERGPSDKSKVLNPRKAKKKRKCALVHGCVLKLVSTSEDSIGKLSFVSMINA